MKKYMQMPKLKEWYFYYEYINQSISMEKLANKYGLTRERMRIYVNKVRKYLHNGNDRILTQEQVKQRMKENNEVILTKEELQERINNFL